LHATAAEAAATTSCRGRGKKQEATTSDSRLATLTGFGANRELINCSSGDKLEYSRCATALQETRDKRQEANTNSEARECRSRRVIKHAAPAQ